MRALHVFPLFGSEPTNGSERHFFMLSKALAARGVQVDVLATRSQTLRSVAAFALRWTTDYGGDVETADGVTIRRFRATPVLPRAAERPLSRLVLDRWRREEALAGSVLPGSHCLVDAYHRRALQRPRIYDFLTLLGRGPLSLPLLAACLRSLGEYDVVLVGFMPFALPWYVTHLARWRGTPVVLLPLFHPEDPSHHFRSLYWCFEQAAAVLAQSPYSASLLRRLWPASNPVEVGPGTDLRAFASPAISGERFRRRHGLEGKRLALFVGRKELYKRYDLAVEAVDLIAHERIALVMVGADVDRRPIISPHVLYLGALPRDELLDAFDACDVLVVPSEHESFGMVLLEAWARRKPVIGNAACGPVASVIADGRDGFVCRNAEEVARAIVRVLTDASLAQRLGEAGHEKVARRYTWECIAERVHDVYRSVTASRRPPDRSAAMGSRDERTPRHHD